MSNQSSVMDAARQPVPTAMQGAGAQPLTGSLRGVPSELLLISGRSTQGTRSGLQDAQPSILGFVIPPSAGLSRGRVDNLGGATEAIRAPVEKAERASGPRILSAHVGMSGAHVQSVNNRGIVAIPDRNRPISHDDISRA